MSGFYLMRRGWQDHPVFGNEPYSKRDAFEWLIANASFQERTAGVLGKVIPLKRGQLCHSVRFLGKAWRWDEAKVRRFISRLQDSQMVEVQTDAGQMVITICNYETYQAPEKQPDAGATQERRSSAAAATQTRKKEKKETKKEILVEAEEFYAEYPRKVAKPKAIQAYILARKKVSRETIFAGLERYRRTKPDYADWAHPATWLNAERWADEPMNGTASDHAPPQTPAAARAMYEERLRKFATTLAKGIPISILKNHEIVWMVRDGCLSRDQALRFIPESDLEVH